MFSQHSEMNQFWRCAKIPNYESTSTTLPNTAQQSLANVVSIATTGKSRQMEKSKIQDVHIDSNEYLAFEYKTLESDFLHQQEYTDCPSSTPVNYARESGKCRRPITLKADLNITKSDVGDTQKTQGKKTHQTKKASEPGRRKRPIALKADLDLTNSNVPNKKKTRGKKTRYRKKTIEPRLEKKASTDADISADTQTFNDTPAPVRSPKGGPSANLPEFCFSWVKRHRRLLLIVGLSFISGILFHSWFGPDEPAAPSQLTDTGQAAWQSMLERSDSGPQSVPNPGNVSDTNTPPSHAINGYPPKHQVYRNPSYSSTWPQQRTSSQNPNYGWSDHGHQMTPRTPSTPLWRDPGGQAAPSYQRPKRQMHTPWSYNFQQYPPE